MGFHAAPCGWLGVHSLPWMKSMIPIPDPPEEPPPRPPEMATIGIEFALSMVALGWLGWWADGMVGWRDHFPVLLVLGVLTAFAWFVWRLKRLLGSGKPPSQPPTE